MTDLLRRQYDEMVSENVRLTAELAAAQTRERALRDALDELSPPQWFESVPSGVRWFCGECQGVISGFSEAEQAEADAAMQHQRKCRWVFGKSLRAALAGGQEAEAARGADGGA